MRNGVIAEEGSPKDIIAKFNSDSLESAFLSVCFTQEKYKVFKIDIFKYLLTKIYCEAERSSRQLCNYRQPSFTMLTTQQYIVLLLLLFYL